MTLFERAMLRLKLLEVTQRQSVICLLAYQVNHREADIIASEGKAVLDKAVDGVGKLL